MTTYNLSGCNVLTPCREWLAHNVSDCVWLSIDIEPEKSDKENMFNLFGIKVETKKYGVLGMKLKE